MKYYADSDSMTQLNRRSCAALLLVHLSLMLIFNFYDADALVNYNIFSTIFYLFCFVLIHKGHLQLYVWLTYLEIVVFMCFSIICLGLHYGYQLYCISLITIIFYVYYVSKKMNLKTIHPFIPSVAIFIAYVTSAHYSIQNEPLYTIDGSVAFTFYVVNSCIVFIFLCVYMNLFVKLAIHSEDTLYSIAHTDKLTELSNRHFMITRLESLNKSDMSDYWLAMLDIDDFKKINDTYGHLCGDFVLKKTADILKSTFPAKNICRWGGEEFLICASKEDIPISKLDDLRSQIASTPYNFNNEDISISITIGAAFFESDFSLDSWIQAADKNLYYGKNNGKNRVVLNEYQERGL